MALHNALLSFSLSVGCCSRPHSQLSATFPFPTASSQQPAANSMPHRWSEHPRSRSACLTRPACGPQAADVRRTGEDATWWRSRRCDPSRRGGAVACSRARTAGAARRRPPLGVYWMDCERAVRRHDCGSENSWVRFCRQ